MAEAIQTLSDDETIKILDEQFAQYIHMAKILGRDVPRQEDRDIIRKYALKCMNLQGNNVDLKKKRNEFFSYFLKLITTTKDMDGPAKYPPDYIAALGEPTVMSKWAPDKTSYCAARVQPGQGALVYLATTDKPELGWELNGFSHLA